MPQITDVPRRSPELDPNSPASQFPLSELEEVVRDACALMEMQSDQLAFYRTEYHDDAHAESIACGHLGLASTMANRLQNAVLGIYADAANRRGGN
jgi:hypothetical protein